MSQPSVLQVQYRGLFTAPNVLHDFYLLLILGGVHSRSAALELGPEPASIGRSVKHTTAVSSQRSAGALPRTDP